MPTTGLFNIPIHLDEKVTFEHSFFVIPNLAEDCILGLDFLIEHKIIVNGGNREIICLRNFIRHSFIGTISSVAITPPIPIYNIDPSLSPSDANQLKSLLDEFSFLFATKLTDLGKYSGVKHTIRTTGGPFRLPPYRTAHAFRSIIKDHVDEMLKSGVIRPSTSPWAAPVTLAPKKDGGLRFCIDYRLLNDVTIRDSYPIPRIDQTIDALHNAKFFTCLDLFSGYWQIEIEESHKEKTAFVCEFGLFEFNRMPFGLTNAPPVFQRAMSSIFQSILYKFCLIYLDDLIIFSKTFHEHLIHIRKVFEILQKNGFRLKPSKCFWAKLIIQYLGHLISEKGVSPDPDKVKAIANFPRPINAAQLKTYLGLTGFYRRFVCHYGSKSHHLTKLTRKGVTFQWGDDQQLAFDELKNGLMTAPILRFPNFRLPFIIHADASGFGVGSILGQVVHEDGADREVVIAYASKHLSERELKWPIIEKEAYAIVHAVKHFYHYLYGRRFTIYSDHRPLEFIMSKRENKGKLARWALALQEYDMEIVYKPGVTNQNADCLSRTPINTISTSYSLGTPSIFLVREEWAAAQANDSYCLQKRKLIGKSSGPNAIVILENGLLGTYDGRLLAPKILRQEILKLYHDHKLAGHLGIAKTLAKIKNRFKWPKMHSDIVNYVRTCLSCAKRKATGKTTAPLKPLPITDYPFERVSLDVIGPLTPTLNGNVYILVLIDHKTRYVEAAAMKNQTAVVTAKHFINKIILRHGVPSQLLSDQGPNFMSEFFTCLCSELGIDQIRTVAYNAKCNGLTEKYNGTICDCLSHFAREFPWIWDELLQYGVHAVNTSDQATLGDNSHYLLYRSDCVLPMDLLPPRRLRVTEEVFHSNWHKARGIADERLIKVQDKMKEIYDSKGTKTTSYEVGDTVLLRNMAAGSNKFDFRWSGPWTIVRKLNDLNYAISCKEKPTPVVVNTNRLKAFTPRIIDTSIPTQPCTIDNTIEPTITLPSENLSNPDPLPHNSFEPEPDQPDRNCTRYNLRKKILKPPRYRN